MDRIARFHELHSDGCFVMPNPWDRGSARRLEAMGFPALATTSSGHAESFGLIDQQITAEEMLEHAAQMASIVDVPLNIDSERLFAEDLSELGAMVEAIAETGAAGCSIEDYRPDTRSIDPLERAEARVGVAADAAAASGLVLTARAEAFLYTDADLDEVIERLVRYRDAGADVVYAPGLSRSADISRVVGELDCPVNVLLWPDGPDVAELAQLGVRRVSTGGALMRVAYAAMEESAAGLLSRPQRASMIDRSALIGAFAAGGAVVREAWDGVPAEARRFRPAPGEWSPHELVIHLADADVNGYLRFRKLVAEPGATVPGYDQDAWAGSLDYHRQDPDLAIDLMVRLRALTHPILTSLGDETWAHSVTHSEVGRWTLEDWLRTYTRHVDDHLAQLEAAVAAWRRSHG